jgi:hypothetical protein
MATGKGLFGALKGLVMEEDPNDTNSQGAQTAAAPQNTNSGSGGYVAAPMSSSPMIDPALLQHLQQVINKRRTPFTSLIEQSEKLRSIIPDDITRLKAAAVSVGGDKASILQAVDIHMNDLDAEAGNFQRFSDSEANTKIGSLKAEAANRERTATDQDARVQALSQEIQQLQQSAAENRAAAAQATVNAGAEQAELDRKSAAFSSALNAVKSNLTTQKSVLSSTL